MVIFHGCVSHNQMVVDVNEWFLSWVIQATKQQKHGDWMKFSLGIKMIYKWWVFHSHPAKLARLSEEFWRGVHVYRMTMYICIAIYSILPHPKHTNTSILFVYSLWVTIFIIYRYIYIYSYGVQQFFDERSSFRNTTSNLDLSTAMDWNGFQSSPQKAF